MEPTAPPNPSFPPTIFAAEGPTPRTTDQYHALFHAIDQAQLTTIYQRRWKVEEYHKSLKKNASMAKLPTRTLATQAIHFFAAVFAYTKREVLKLKCGLGHFRLKAQRYTVGLKAMYQQLALLRA